MSSTPEPKRAKRPSYAQAPPRKYLYACDTCRARKRRCDSQKPRCGLCVNLNQKCVYKGAASRRFVESLQERYNTLRGIIRTMRESSPETASKILSSINPDLLEEIQEGNSPGDSIPAGPLETQFEAKSEGVELKEPARIDKDSNDRITLHGPSSLYYLSPTAEATALDTGSMDSFNNTLGIDQQLIAGWVDVMSVSVDFPVMGNDVYLFLLRLHWTWVQPLFGFVHRTAFLRDMHRPQSPKALFSPFLLYTICTHAARQSDVVLINQHISSSSETNHSDPFLAQARLMIGREVEKGSSLACVQSCLLLSAKEIAMGKISQAWIYLGMAIRMLQDLGVDLDGQRREDRHRLSEEDIELRRHSFWSAYAWDKMVSLYLGRAPMLQITLHSPSPPTIDDKADEELWSPVGNKLDEFPPYMPRPSHALSTFASFCKLTQIVNDILVYDTGGPAAPNLSESRDRLASWRDQLPAKLRVDATSGFDTVPPSHVINLNCLYHMVSILLDRRCTRGKPSQSTVTAAFEICVLAQLSQKHFQDRQAVISHCYCIYTAATTFLSMLRHRDDQPWMSNEESIIATSLKWCLERLTFASATVQALQRPLDILREHLTILQARIPSLGILGTNYPQSHSGLMGVAQPFGEQFSLPTSHIDKPHTPTIPILVSEPGSVPNSFWGVLDLWDRENNG